MLNSFLTFEIFIESLKSRGLSSGRPKSAIGGQARGETSGINFSRFTTWDSRIMHSSRISVCELRDNYVCSPLKSSPLCDRKDPTMDLEQLLRVLAQFATDPVHWLLSLRKAVPIAVSAWVLAYLGTVVTDEAGPLVLVLPALGILLAIALYIKENVRDIPAKEDWCFDRWGRKIVLGPGLNLVSPADKFKEKVDKKAFKVDVFPPGHKVEYTGPDGRPISAETKCCAWLIVSNSELYTWTFANKLERIQKLLANYADPALHGHEYEKMLKPEARRKIEADLTNERDPLRAPESVRSILKALAELGVEFREEEGFTIEDVIKPEAVEKIDLKRRDAEANAEVSRLDATAKAEAIGLKAAARKAAIKEYKRIGLTAEQAAKLVADLEQAEALASQPNKDIEVLVERGGDSSTRGRKKGGTK